MAQFLEMGGYGAYVWPSYAAFALVLLGLTLWALGRNRRVRRELASVEALRRAASASGGEKE